MLFLMRYESVLEEEPFKPIPSCTLSGVFILADAITAISFLLACLFTLSSYDLILNFPVQIIGVVFILLKKAILIQLV